MSNPILLFVLLVAVVQTECFKIGFGTEVSEGPGFDGEPVLVDTRPKRGRIIEEDYYGVPPEDIVYVRARNVDQPSVINRLLRKLMNYLLPEEDQVALRIRERVPIIRPATNLGNDETRVKITGRSKVPIIRPATNLGNEYEPIPVIRPATNLHVDILE